MVEYLFVVSTVYGPGPGTVGMIGGAVGTTVGAVGGVLGIAGVVNSVVMTVVVVASVVVVSSVVVVASVVVVSGIGGIVGRGPGVVGMSAAQFAGAGTHLLRGMSNSWPFGHGGIKIGVPSKLTQSSISLIFDFIK